MVFSSCNFAFISYCVNCNNYGNQRNNVNTVYNQTLDRKSKEAYIMATKSIVSNERKCWVCNIEYGLHKHHIYEGVANRKLSEKYGCWVYLCGKHHNLSNEGVHFNRDLDLRLKEYTQERFEAHLGTRDDFRAIFGKSYL